MERSNIFKEHADTAVLLLAMLTSLVTSIMWLNGKFSDIDRRLVRIETVLVVRGIMPADIATKDISK